MFVSFNLNVAHVLACFHTVCQQKCVKLYVVRSGSLRLACWFEHRGLLTAEQKAAAVQDCHVNYHLIRAA